MAVASYDRLFIFLGPLSGVATPDDAALVIPLGLNTFGAFAAADIDGDGREDLIRPELTGEPGAWDYELVVHLATDLFP